GLFEEVGEDGADFLKYVKKGGKPANYIAVVANSFDLEELDEDNDAQVNKTLRYYLSTYEKLEPDDLEDRMSWLKDNGKNKTYAKKYFNIIKKDEKEDKEELHRSLEEQEKNKKEAVKQFNEALLGDIETAEKVGDFKITKKEQKEL